jgi:excisionase family DNA binding protein
VGVQQITHRTKSGQQIKFAETAEVTRLVTAKVIAETLSVHERTIHLWAASGKIPSKRIGATVRFNFAEVMAVVNGGGQVS